MIHILTILALIFITKNVLVLINPKKEITDAEFFSVMISTKMPYNKYTKEQNNLFKKQSFLAFADAYIIFGLFTFQFKLFALVMVLEFLLLILFFGKYRREKGAIIDSKSKYTPLYIGMMCIRSLMLLLFAIFTLLNMLYFNIHL